MAGAVRVQGFPDRFAAGPGRSGRSNAPHRRGRRRRARLRSLGTQGVWEEGEMANGQIDHVKLGLVIVFESPMDIIARRVQYSVALIESRRLARVQE